MAYTLPELHVKQSADTLCDVKALVPVDVLAYMLEWKKKKGRDTCRDTRSDVQVNALLKTLADSLAVVKGKKFSDALGPVQAALLANKLAATLE